MNNTYLAHHGILGMKWEFEDQKHSLQEPEDILPNLQMIRMRYQHVKLLLRIGEQCPMPI